MLSYSESVSASHAQEFVLGLHSSATSKEVSVCFLLLREAESQKVKSYINEVVADSFQRLSQGASRRYSSDDILLSQSLHPMIDAIQIPTP